ncbi:hypothetical protein SOVF_102470 [Spinacia oleracea]|nr:hypothetical protein SOVF_102470 [Spinacia oleracea]
MGRKMSRSRKRGKVIFNSDEEGHSLVDSRSKSEQDDCKDKDFKADGYEDVDDDEVVQSEVVRNVKRKRG